jgi:non-ribosomal peptide synthetase component F/acyl carrier protein
MEAAAVGRRTKWGFEDTESSIPDRFDAVVRAWPERIAVASGAERWTYAEVDSAAERVASTLLSRRGGPGGRVALLTPPGPTQVAAALGALRAGRVAVALNRDYPVALLSAIRESIEADSVIVTSGEEDRALKAGFAASALMDADETAEGGGPRPAVLPNDVAFLIFTSGSAGRPKGVIQTHRNVLSNVMRRTKGTGLRDGERVAVLAPLSGAYGLVLTLIPLLNGGTLCPFDVSTNGFAGLADWIDRERISFLPLNPSVFRNFVATLGPRRLDSVRAVEIAGEPAYGSDVIEFERHFAADSTLYSVLASSEGGCLTLWRAPRGTPPAGRLPVGPAQPGVTIELLREDGSRAEPGEVGEIVVSGPFLSPGYWRDPALSAAQFATGEDGRRRFFTRDLAVGDADGVLTVTGRRDQMVKVHGHRVELSEVELAIAALPEVASVVVSATDGGGGTTELVAHVIARCKLDVTASAMRARLRDTLPGHAIPTAFVAVERFPITAQGKLDRPALLAANPPSPRRVIGSRPEGETEELLAAIWAGALGLDSVGRDERFLDLGGDSLEAAVIAAGIEEAFGGRWDLRVVIGEPTIAEMAAAIERGRERADRLEDAPLLRTSRAVPLPLSSTQARIWRHSGAPSPSVGYNAGAIYRITGSLDVESLRAAIQILADRHEPLRTAFVEYDGAPAALVRGPRPIAFTFEDLRARPDPAAAVQERHERWRATPRTPTDGEPARFLLLRTGEAEHHLLRTSHHLIADAPSWVIFVGQLAEVYERLARGELVEADPPSLQHADFAVWEHDHLARDSPRFEAEIAYWRAQFERPPQLLALPFARSRRAEDATPGDGYLLRGQDPAISERLAAFSRSEGATFFMVHLAAFVAALRRFGGPDDLVLGTYVTTRRRAELQQMFGDFHNLVSLRLSLSPDSTFRDLVRLTRERLLGAVAHSEVPYEDLLDALRERAVQAPPIEAIAGVSWNLDPIRFAGLELEEIRARVGRMPWGFTITFERTAEQLASARFDARRYDPAAVAAFLDELAAVVARVSEHPDTPLSEL